MNRLPVFLLGQGLGPLNRRLSRFLVEYALNIVDLISWRDKESYDTACEWKVCTRMYFGPDLLWTLPQKKWDGGGSVVICWRHLRGFSRNKWKILLKALDNLIIENNVNIIWLIFDVKNDINLYDYLVNEGLLTQTTKKSSSQICAREVSQVMDLFAHSKLVIAMRLHALILSQLSGCPAFGLSYDQKVLQVAKYSSVPYFELKDISDTYEIFKAWNLQLNRPIRSTQIDNIQAQSQLHIELLERFIDDHL